MPDHGRTHLISRRLLLGGLAGASVGLAACDAPWARTRRSGRAATPAPDPTGTASPAPTPSTGPTSGSSTSSSTSSSPPQRPRPPGPLVGVGAWPEQHAGAALADSGSRWFYSWQTAPDWIDVPAGCEFVPMIIDRTALTARHLAEAKAHGTTLLAFNEPELPLQADMTVDEVIAAWPKLEATGLRLSAPAVAGDAHREGSYFDTFMTRAQQGGHRVDFVPVHWYLAPRLVEAFTVEAAVADLNQYLIAVHERYRLPVWLTEFSLITWYPTYQTAPSSAVQAEFLEAAALMMRELDFVERWAWFSLTPADYAPRPALYDTHGRITAAGRAFRQVA